MFYFLDVRHEPTDATDVRPLHLQGRSHQAGLRAQAQVPLLPGGAEPRRRQDHPILINLVLSYYLSQRLISVLISAVFSFKL